ncbi:MAG TPA: hypothetical protein VK013_15905 [Myxococcaceae bacterium]|nr:hypothetical protein [Myxococcaceae bacterium]
MSLPWWLEIFLGLGLGYLVGSWVESFMHEHVSDAHPRRVKAWMRAPRLLRPLINTHYSHHTIHHVRTFRAGHTTQFRSEEERSQLTEVLLARGRHGRIIIAGAFGTRLHGSGALVFVAPLVIFFPFFWWGLGPAGFVASCFTLLLSPFMSHFVHPWLHRPFEQGQTEAPAWLAWLLRTRYMRAVYRNHFLHHRYGGVSNFNLVLGADILRGRARAITSRDLEVMAELGMPLPDSARPGVQQAHG